MKKVRLPKFSDVKCGDKVIDEVSGFKGVVVSVHNYLAGCQRATVQPPIDKEGKLPVTETFDSPLLKVVKVFKEPVTQHTGGPEKYSDERPI